MFFTVVSRIHALALDDTAPLIAPLGDEEEPLIDAEDDNEDDAEDDADAEALALEGIEPEDPGS